MWTVNDSYLKKKKKNLKKTKKEMKHRKSEHEDSEARNQLSRKRSEEKLNELECIQMLKLRSVTPTQTKFR